MVTKMLGGDKDHDHTMSVIALEKEAWNKFYDEETSGLEWRCKCDLESLTRQKVALANERMRHLQLITDEGAVVVGGRYEDGDGDITMEESQEDEGEEENTVKIQSTSPSSLSWGRLSPDIVRNILTFYVFPLSRYTHELLIAPEENNDHNDSNTSMSVDANEENGEEGYEEEEEYYYSNWTSEDFTVADDLPILNKERKMVHTWLMKQLFGYFPSFHGRDVILPIFSCFSLPLIDSAITDEMVTHLINALTRVKTVFYLDGSDWLGRQIMLDMSGSIVPRDYYARMIPQPISAMPTKKSGDKNKVEPSLYTFTVFFVGGPGRDIHTDDCLTKEMISGNLSTAHLYAILYKEYQYTFNRRKFILLWSNDDQSEFPCSPDITIEQAIEEHRQRQQQQQQEEVCKELLLKFDGDLSYDHITQFRMCVVEDLEEGVYFRQSGRDEFISRCTNLTELAAGGYLTDFSIFPKLKKLLYVVPWSDEQNILLNLRECHLLREFQCNKELVKEEFDQLATLVHLTKLSVRTREAGFRINPNLTSLKLTARSLNSQTMIKILNMENLKELNLKCEEPMDAAIFPYFASNHTITNLSLYKPEASLVSYVAQNRTIRHLIIEQMRASHYSDTNIGQILPQLVSFTGCKPPAQFMDSFIQQTQNLKSLELLVDSDRQQLESFDRILLELPQLARLVVHK